MDFKVIEAISEMTGYISQINLPDNDQADVTYYSTRAICSGLASILTELSEIRQELESRR